MSGYTIIATTTFTPHGILRKFLREQSSFDCAEKTSRAGHSIQEFIQDEKFSLKGWLPKLDPVMCSSLVVR